MTATGHRDGTKSVLITDDEKMLKVFAAVMDCVEYEKEPQTADVLYSGVERVDDETMGEPRYRSSFQLLHEGRGTGS